MELVSVELVCSGGNKSKTEQAGSKKKGGGRGGAPYIGSNVRVAKTIEYGILRRLIMKNGQYEFLVDRRCVWRFCLVENLRDTSSMSINDKEVELVMNRAKANLKRSERDRRGNRVYDSHLYNGENLAGGEFFPLTLRHMVASTSLNAESQLLAPRRMKESIIRSEFRNKLSNWDKVGDIVALLNSIHVKILFF